MNTLSKQFTRSFFKNDNGYEELVKKWKEYVNSETCELNSSDYLFYAVVRGKNYKKAFFPGRKMEHYNCPEGFYIARYCGYKAKFGDLFADILSDDWYMKITKIMPSVYKNNLYEVESYDNDLVRQCLGQEVGV